MSKSGSFTASLALPHLPAAGEKPAFTDRERLQARRLAMVLALTAVFFCVQFAGALWADSDVLRVEALHLLTDVAALGMAYWAMRVAVRRPTARFTFGLRRAEPVAAIFNALLVLAATVFLVVEALGNLAGEAAPRADRMLYIAAIGMVVSSISAWLIHGAIGHHDEPHASHDPHHGHGHEHTHAHKDEPHAHEPHAHDHDASGHDHDASGHDLDAPKPCDDHSHRHIAQQVQRRGHGHALNLRGAWLHLFGDALGSFAALIAAVAIRFGASPKFDSLAAIVVAVILIYGGIRLLKDAVLILLEASPPHLDVEQVRRTILGVSGAAELHDLHVWTLGAGHDAITAHVSMSSNNPDPSLARRIEEAVRHRFHVEYVTIQVELGGVTCQTESLES